MPEPYCFLRYHIGYGTLQPCIRCQRAALLRGILRRENPTYGAPLDRAVVLKWLYSLSRRKTFAGGKCALYLVNVFSFLTVPIVLPAWRNKAVLCYVMLSATC